MANVTTKNLDKVAYTYDEQGNRTSKTVNGQRTEYFFRTDGKITAENTGRDIIFYRYKYDGSPFSIQIKGEVYFYIANPQRDVAGLIDAASYTYDVWGNVISVEGPSPDVGRHTPLCYRGYYQCSFFRRQTRRRLYCSMFG